VCISNSSYPFFPFPVPHWWPLIFFSFWRLSAFSSSFLGASRHEIFYETPSSYSFTVTFPPLPPPLVPFPLVFPSPFQLSLPLPSLCTFTPLGSVVPLSTRTPALPPLLYLPTARLLSCIHVVLTPTFFGFSLSEFFSDPFPLSDTFPSSHFPPQDPPSLLVLLPFILVFFFAAPAC